MFPQWQTRPNTLWQLELPPLLARLATARVHQHLKETLIPLPSATHSVTPGGSFFGLVVRVERVFDDLIGRSANFFHTNDF